MCQCCGQGVRTVGTYKSSTAGRRLVRTTVSQVGGGGDSGGGGAGRGLSFRRPKANAVSGPAAPVAAISTDLITWGTELGWLCVREGMDGCRTRDKEYRFPYFSIRELSRGSVHPFRSVGLIGPARVVRRVDVGGPSQGKPASPPLLFN